MQAFFVYLLKVIIYSGILFGYYHIALRNKRFHYYNRFYLLMSVALSLSLPFLQLELWQWKSNNPQVITLANIIVTHRKEHESNGFSLSLTLNDFLLLVYMVIAVCLLLSFIAGLLKLIRMKKQYPSEKIGDILFINTDLQQAPFSFFKNLFWKSSIDISGETGKQIFRHELTHIEQKHSSDKLFLQVTTLLFWLNPFYWLIQKELSLIHEFIADEKAIDNKDAEAFALMLLQSQFGRNAFLPVQSFYYSPIKRRLRMLTSSSKTSHSYARRILALPVLSLTILLFAFKMSNNYRQTFSSHANAPFVLVVDAGHGGSENGATGSADINEKTLNLSIANKIKELAPGYGITVKLTRTEDATVSLENRMNTIKSEKPDAFISIHVNGAPEGAAPNDNFEVYITKNNATGNYNQSRLLGSSIIQSIKANLPVSADIMQRSHGIYVLDQNPYPAVLLECGYMNSEKSMQQLSTDAGVEKVAKGILDGVVAYANSNKQDTTVIISDTSKKQPLYILDGKEISAEEGKKVDGNTIESVNVLKDKEAVKQYGEKGKNGVVIITSKNKNVSSNSSGNINLDRNHADTSIHPLVIVDGKEISKTSLSDINPDYIESISVLKSDESVKQYGAKGKDGVVIITTKNKKPLNLYLENVKPAENLALENVQSEENYEKVFTTAQEPPSFPGGNEAWIAYLQRNLRADVPAQHKAPAGNYTVIVQFRVDENGNLSDFKAATDPGYGTADEAVRVIQRGPKWIPAKQNGKIVTAIAKQPITFQVQEGR